MTKPLRTPGSPRHSTAPTRWSPSVLFAIILAMSAGFSIREIKEYNSNYWAHSMESNDADSVLPSKSVPWSSAANETASQNSEPSTTTEKIKNPQVTSSTNSTIPSETDVEATKQTNTSSGETTQFKRYDKVVIVTKIHGPHQWKLVDQSLCLLHNAYNHKVLYDHVIFSTTPVPDDLIEDLQKVVAPAKVSVVVDNMGFHEEVAALPKATYDLFLERCNTKNTTSLKWWSECQDPKGNKGNRLAYNWQAEFRSVRIWEHPALEQYKYMLWLDADGFPSREWLNDPIGYFIENKGVVMFDHFPQGATRKHSYDILRAFNDTCVCDLTLDKDKGHLTRSLINKHDLDLVLAGNRSHMEAVSCYKDTLIPMIHGFMHITDLDWYRQPKVINGLKGLLGDCFLCRSPDDQLAVTIPAAIYEPEKAWDMRSHGFDLKVVHNFHLDGQEKAKPPGFVKYWDEKAAKEFPRAALNCKVTQRD